MSGRAFLRDTRGASAAEFALVLPLALLLLFGLIDVGRYVWAINQAEKATQVGARWAVATDMIPSGLADYSFAIDGGILQGEPVPPDAFPGVTCSAPGGTAECACAPGGTCDFPLDADNAAFTNLVEHMKDIYPRIKAEDVRIDYSWSGLGFSGDPNGPDVAPIVTVQLEGITFAPLFGALFDVNLPMPDVRYSLTLEDGAGSMANY